MAQGESREDDRAESAGHLDLGRSGGADAAHATEDAAARIRYLEEVLRQSQEQLRRHERRDQTLAHAGGQVIWTTDGAGHVAGASPGWCAFTGQRPRDAQGLGWLAAVHPDDRTHLKAAWQGAHAMRGPRDECFRIRRTDGEYRLFLARCVPDLDERGDVREWVISCADITERETPDTARRHGDEHARQVIEHAPDGVFLADSDGRYIEVNLRAAAMLGYIRPEDLVGKTISDLIPPEEIPKLEDATRVVLAGGTDVREWRLRRADGNYLPVEISAKLLPDGAWQAFVRDLTERRRLEREAAERASQIEAILDAMSDGVFVYDAQGRTVRVNAAARQLFALDADPHYFTLLPEERAALLNVRDVGGRPLSLARWGLLRILAGETSPNEAAEDFIVRRLDGRDMEVSAAGGAVRDAAGNVTGAVVVMRDVTERRLLEQRALDTVDAVLALASAAVAPRETPPSAEPVAPARAADEASTAGVIGHIAALIARAVGCKRVAVATVDPETEIMRPVTLAGFTPEEDARWWAGWAPNCTVAERMGEDVASALRAGEVFQIDTENPTAHARLAPYHVQTLFVVPMRVRERLVGALAIDDAGVEHTFTERDRTLAGAVGKLAALVIERERLLREREETTAKALALEEANRRMDEFLSIAAHELKTPLTSMKVNVQITQQRVRRLQEAVEGTGVEALGQLAQTHDLVTRVDLAINRQERLVDDLLDVSRIQAGRLEMRPVRVDLGDVVRQTVEEQRASHAERAISLEMPDPPLLVDADPDRIGQVVANYLTNALKYAPPALPIAVRLVVSERMARVSVRDQGPGIAANQHARIWERFHRVPGIGHLSGSGVGLGLGLYISREIVERHGGAVGVESAPGEGSTFWFELPLPREPA